MRTATGLTVVAVGAILAFAVTSNPPYFNIQIAGWVIMLTGIAGMILSRRDYSSLRRLIVARRRGGRSVKSNGRARMLATGQMLPRVPSPGSSLPEPRPPMAQTTEETTPGTAQPSEESRN